MGDEEKKDEGGPNRIMVFLRIRPAKKNEIVESEGTHYLMDVQPNNKDIILTEGNKTYNFDYVFHGNGVKNRDIYDRVGAPVIENIFKGFWGTMMVYGQTGTGKSFTMCNFDAQNEGVIARAMQRAFEKIDEDQERTYTVKFSFLQIYLDKLQDLFNPDKKEEQKLTRDAKGVSFPGITERDCTSYAHFKELYDDGNQHRVITATKMNPESSRGHASLFMQIASVPKDDPGGENRAGKLFMIDLAGYERFSKTGVQEGIMKEEAKTINASLLALGNVVQGLAEKTEHVPWRNAKLTRMLEDAIGGKAKCSIILTAGPSSDHLHETTGTLYFGQRAMSVKTNAKLAVNVDWQKLAKKLQEMLSSAESKISTLEMEAAKRQLEREEAFARMNAETAAVQQRHEEQLQKLLQDGATPEQIEKLIEANKRETDLLTEQHDQERDAIVEQQEKDMQEQLVEKSRAAEDAVERAREGTSADIDQLRRDVAFERSEKEKFKNASHEAEREARRLVGELNEAKIQLTSAGLDFVPSAPSPEPAAPSSSAAAAPAPSGGGGGGSGGGGGGYSKAEMRRELERRVEQVRTMLEETHVMKLEEVEQPLREELANFKKMYEDLRANADAELQTQKDALTQMYEEELETTRRTNHEVQDRLKKNHMTIKGSYQKQREQLQEENLELTRQLAKLGVAPEQMGVSSPGNEAPLTGDALMVKKEADMKVAQLEQKIADMKADVDYLTTEKDTLNQLLTEARGGPAAASAVNNADRAMMRPAAVRKLKDDFEALTKVKQEMDAELFKLKAAQAMSGPQRVGADDDENDEPDELDQKPDMFGDFESMPKFVDKMLKFPYFNGAKPVKTAHDHILNGLTTDLDEYRRAMRIRVVILGANGSGKTSVAKCMTSAVPLIKSLPDVHSTLHPSIQSGSVDDLNVNKHDLHRLYIKCEDVDDSGGLQKSRASMLLASFRGNPAENATKVYFDIVDTPGASGFWRGMPPQLMPGKNVCYCITYNLTQPVSAIKDDISAQLRQIHASAHHDTGSKNIGGATPRIAVCLVGTHRDQLRDHNAPAVLATVNKVTRVLGETFFQLRGEESFGLIVIGNYAVSCADWSVLSAKGNRGPQSFRELFMHMLTTSNKLSDVKPSGFVATGREAASHTSYVLGDDTLEAPVERTIKMSSVDQRLRRGIVTLMSAIVREQKVRWMMGEAELRALVEDHLGLKSVNEALSIAAVNFVIRELLSRGVLGLLPVGMYAPKYLPRPSADTKGREPLPRHSIVVLDPLRMMMLYSTFMSPQTVLALPKDNPLRKDRQATLCDSSMLAKVVGSTAAGVIPQAAVQAACARLLSLTSADVRLMMEILCVMGLGMGLKTESALLSPVHFKRRMSHSLISYTSYLLTCYGDGVGRKYTLNTVPPAFFSRLQTVLAPFSHAPSKDPAHLALNWADASLLVLDKARLKWGIYGSHPMKEAVMQLKAPVRGIVKVEGETIFVAIAARGPSNDQMKLSARRIMDVVHHHISVLCTREFTGVRATYQEMEFAGSEQKRKEAEFYIKKMMTEMDASAEEIIQQQEIVGAMSDPKGQELENAITAFPDDLQRDD